MGRGASHHHGLTKRTTLTQRQTEIMDLVATGISRRDIAERLVLSPVTVSNHMRNILRILEVHSSLEAILKWREMRAGEVSVTAEVVSSSPSMLTVTELWVRFPGADPVRFVPQPTAEAPRG